MPSTRFTCPHCSTTLKTGRTDLIGRKIKCQQCGQKFVAGSEHVQARDRMVPVATGIAPPPSSATVELPAVSQTNIQTAAPPQTRNGQTSIASGSPKSRTSTAPVAAPFVPPQRSSAENTLVPVLLAALLILLLGGGLAAYMIIASDPATVPVEQAQSDSSSDVIPEAKPDPVPEGPSEPAEQEPEKNSTEPPSSKETLETPVKDIEPTKDKSKDEGGKSPPKGKTTDTLPSKGLYNPPKIMPKNPVKKNEDAYRSSLTAGNQKLVNHAIDRGVKYLRGAQQGDGGWGHTTYKVGYAALPALTLLECGVPPNDPAIQNAAACVRKNSFGLDHTYQLSLAILFLDKLGEKKDHDLIRKLSMRLIAGQTYDGGWSYRCPILDNRQRYELVTFLHETRPKPLIPMGKDGENPLIPISDDGSGREIIPLNFDNSKDNGGLVQSVGGSDTKAEEKKGEGIALPFPPGKKSSGEKQESEPKAGNDPPSQPAFNINRLSPDVRSLPIIQQQALPKFLGRKNAFVVRKKGRSDNSNTQFAIMALWAARRYNVPIEKTMSLVDQRFQSSQNQDGGWGYLYIHKSRPSMTCVGLIGLGAAHGSFMETLGKTWKNKKFKMAKQDPAIVMGLHELNRHVSESPTDWSNRKPLVNLYFLWSVERVAMLYNLKTIGKKDWYNWAAHMLVTNQRPDGGWFAHNYHGSSPIIDTSLALLILRRANLVQDLTQSLQEFVPITDPGNR